MKYVFTIFILFTIGFYFLTPQTSTRKEAIHIITSYAKGQTNLEPTLQNYKDANISNITADNIHKVNKKILEMQSKEYHSPYRYNPTDDYQYTFGNSKFTAISINIKDSIIDLRNLPIVKNHTIFLKIIINSMELGEYFTPKVTLHYKNKIYQHVLEPGAKGIRYLNLSNLNLTQNTKIKLHGKHITIKDQNATLVLFQNPKIKNKKILIIAPHPDDAEIAAYGLYSQYHNNVHIVTITAGDAGTDLKYNEVFNSTKEQYLAKGKQRVIDSITVPLYGDIPPEHCINLGFFDGKLRDMSQNKLAELQSIYIKTADITTFRKYNVSTLATDLNGTSNWYSLVENLSYLLEQIKPDIIVTPHHALDKHSDHQYTSKAVYEALKKANIKKGLLFLYTNHANRSEYYPYGQVGDAITLPPEMDSAIYFNSIYSHPLSKATQKNKILVLEQMSDLRFTPEGSLFQSPCKDKLDLLCKDYSYLRRSVRSNELFFIIDIKNIQ